MTFFEPDRQSLETEDSLPVVAVDRLPEEILAPVIAGAYARGITDTLEVLGLPVLFIDRDGRVLSSNGAAGQHLRGPLQVRSHHLVADGDDDNRRLSELIAATLSEPTRPCSAVLSGNGLRLHAVSLPDRLMAPGQIVRTIIVIDDGRDQMTEELVRRLTTAS